MKGIIVALSPDPSNRQNAHSMTLAVKGVAELFMLLNREGELYRQTLSFSISHIT